MFLARLILLALALALPTLPAGAARPDGNLELAVVDAETKQPIAARMTLRRGGGRPLTSRDLGVAPYKEHFYVDGQTSLGLRRGQYTFKLSAGPEHQSVSGHFEIERRAEDSKTIEVRRVVRLPKEGWHASDMLAERGGKDLDVAVRGELLSYCPLTAWRFELGKWKEIPSAESPVGSPLSFGPSSARLRNDAGDLLFIRTDGPITKSDLNAMGEGSLDDLRNAREQGLRVIAADATSWRLPVWLAAGVLDAVVVVDANDQPATRRVQRWGKPRDATRFPKERGAARWREAIYFHTLNTGLSLPAAAGSGTGGNKLPLGASRVYANCGEAFDIEAWWEAFDAGEAFVTNGPLLRPMPRPGRTYRLEQDATDVSVALSLTTSSQVEYLEIVQNGEVEHNVPLNKIAGAQGRVPAIDCSGSGWFLLRAVAVDAKGYRRGMTAPYFYQPLDGEPHVSLASCEFFLKWLEEAQREIPADELAFAREFWEERVRSANAP